MRSVITRSGAHSRNTTKPSSGSLAVRTSKACAESAARRARVICGSSSITRILPGMRALLLGRFHYAPNEIATMMQSKTSAGKAVPAISNVLNWREVLRVGTATLGVAVITALLHWAGVNQTAAGLLFLTTVVWFATRAGIRSSLY